MIFGALGYAVLEAARQKRLAEAKKSLMEDYMRECERKHYGRDAIDVEAREVTDVPLLPP